MNSRAAASHSPRLNVHAREFSRRTAEQRAGVGAGDGDEDLERTRTEKTLAAGATFRLVIYVVLRTILFDIKWLLFLIKLSGTSQKTWAQPQKLAM